MRRLLAIGVSLVFAAGAAACGGGDDTAQQQQQQPDATGQQPGATGQQQTAEPQVDVSDDELVSFVQVSMALEEFQAEMRSRMSEASGQEEGMKVREQLMQERDSIIAASDLEGPARYQELMKAVKMSETLQKRYTSLRDSVEAASSEADTAS